MNFKGLKMTLTNLGVMVTQLNNYKMRFVGAGGFVLGVVTTIKADNTHERIKGKDK